METPKNCENCSYYTDHKNGVLMGDGICKVVINKPKTVRRWFTGCKYWKKEDKNGTE